MNVTPADYVKLLQIYARSHRKAGKPYLAEALHPDTGSFEGHDGDNHSEHYFHSGYCDLVITGLVGLIPRDDDTLEINPLAPADWDYFALVIATNSEPDCACWSMVERRASRTSSNDSRSSMEPPCPL